MRIDVNHQFNEGMNNLTTWRIRYNKDKYCEKVLLNLFYRKYTTSFMWDDIQNSFQTKLFGGRKILWKDAFIGFKELLFKYSDKAKATQPKLINLLNNKPETIIGGLAYSDYADRIKGSKIGNMKDIEEIEFAYLHYLLNDQLILMWSALGGTGLNKIDALAQMSGVVIEKLNLSSYAEVESVIGQLSTAPYLHKNYNPFTPLL